MGILRGIHHIEILTKNLGSLTDYFSTALGYQIHCIQKNGDTFRTVVKSGDSVFVLKNAIPCRKHYLHYCYYDNFKAEFHIKDDTVYDIALEVDNVQKCFQKMSDSTGVILPPTTISDYHGKVDIAIVKSCVGNVVHTLLNTSSYKGRFLPGYTCPEPVTTSKKRTSFYTLLKESGYSFSSPNPTILNPIRKHVTHFDHITLACDTNGSDYIMNWYQEMLGMKRCTINMSEGDDGFTVKYGDTGMCLKALDYWKCQKNGIETVNGSVKFVIAEPLTNSANNQITTFLTEHGGPGIQHVGLHVDNIVHAVRDYRSQGIQLMAPPDAYYTEIGRLDDIRKLDVNVDVLKEIGVLIDTEEDTKCPWDKNRMGFLMQVFTKPIFSRDTFFLEFIQRCGANGFGAGNITALWRSVDAAMKDSKKHVVSVGTMTDCRKSDVR